MIEIIKRKKIESLILNIIIIVVVISTIILNSDNYKQIFMEENLITSEETLNSAIENDKRFVTLDLTDAELTRFSIKDNKTDEILVNTYQISYSNQTLIIFLKENTAVTNKIKGELVSPVNEKLEIKEELTKELKDANVIDICFSNVDYIIQERIIKFKFILSISIIILSVLFSILDIFYYINPKKTKKYKRYLKK